MHNHIQSLSGKQGREDFQLWLEDCKEASVDCQWSDKEGARWFSWFITGPAKAIWQRTLRPHDKIIVEVNCGSL